jgi:hypothetical protein
VYSDNDEARKGGGFQLDGGRMDRFIYRVFQLATVSNKKKALDSKLPGPFSLL